MQMIMSETKKIYRIGEKRMMSCGMEAEIIEYFNSNNITLQFEDGVIVTNKTYRNYKDGYIAHPSINVLKNKHEKRVEERLGTTKMMNCGMMATIVAYRTGKDVDIEFEDGYLATNKCYSCFKIGAIRNPNVISRIKQQRLGETRKMNCGFDATIIAYESSKKITIQFEDGLIKKTSYFMFARGNVSHLDGPDLSIKSGHVGETKIMNCGLSATIIAYRGCMNIDIKFENGDIKTNVKYHNFLKGGIALPNTTRIKVEKVGETKIMNNGLKATIIAYRRSNDIDVQFEDGFIVYKKQYGSFKKGHIFHPKS